MNKLDRTLLNNFKISDLILTKKHYTNIKLITINFVFFISTPIESKGEKLLFTEGFS